MLAPVPVSPAIDTVISIEEAKTHCRIDASQTEEDLLVEGFINAATVHLEKILGMAFVTRPWRQDYESFADRLSLPFLPVDDGTLAITYYDADGNANTLDAAIYRLLTDEHGSYVELASGETWPSTATRPDAVSVYFEAGVYPSEVPAPLRVAVGLLTGHYYEIRKAASETAMTDIPWGVDTLIRPYRRMNV